MKYTKVFISLMILIITSCDSSKNKSMTENCSDNCMAKSNTAEISCKLTTPEMQKRKETIIKSLRSQIIKRKELKDGYAFKFPGTDKMVDELAEFIKTERECCDFFTFNLSISGDKSEAWLQLTGKEGCKDFITMELGL